MMQGIVLKGLQKPGARGVSCSWRKAMVSQMTSIDVIRGAASFSMTSIDVIRSQRVKGQEGKGRFLSQKKKVNGLVKWLRKLRSKGRPNAKELARLAGMLVSMSFALGPVTRLRTRGIYDMILNRTGWYTRMEWCGTAKSEVEFWWKNFEEFHGAKPSAAKPNLPEFASRASVLKSKRIPFLILPFLSSTLYPFLFYLVFSPLSHPFNLSANPNLAVASSQS